MDKSLKAQAYALAGHTPEYLSKPTLPPMDWAQNGEIVTVVLADGRKVSASIQEINALMFPPVVKPVPSQAGSEEQSKAPRGEAEPEEIKKPVTTPRKRKTV